MDVVGAIANIWALLEAAKVVSKVCIDYNKAVKSSQWELPKVLSEVEELCLILENLRRQLEEIRTGPNKERLPALQALCSPKPGLLNRCLHEISDLGKKLHPPDWTGTDTRRAAIWLAGSWPMKKSSVQESLRNLERFKSTFSMALICDDM